MTSEALELPKRAEKLDLQYGIGPKAKNKKHIPRIFKNI